MKKILLTVLVWILPTVLWGKQLSDKQYIFQRIDVREGLSYQVNCMTVSHRTGHAWMGTKNGIGRLYQPPPSAFGMTAFFSEDLTNYTNMIIRLGKSLFSVRLLPI